MKNAYRNIKPLKQKPKQKHRQKHYETNTTKEQSNQQKPNILRLGGLLELP